MDVFAGRFIIHVVVVVACWSCEEIALVVIKADNDQGRTALITAATVIYVDISGAPTGKERSEGDN